MSNESKVRNLTAGSLRVPGEGNPPRVSRDLSRGESVGDGEGVGESPATEQEAKG